MTSVTDPHGDGISVDGPLTLEKIIAARGGRVYTLDQILAMDDLTPEDWDELISAVREERGE